MHVESEIVAGPPLAGVPVPAPEALQAAADQAAAALRELVAGVALVLGGPVAVEVGEQVLAGRAGSGAPAVGLPFGVETVGVLRVPAGSDPVELVPALARATRRAVVAADAAWLRPGIAVRPAAGLTATLTAVARRTGALVEIWPLPPLTPELTGAVLRIAEEGLTNAARHAPGAPARVRVRARGGFLDVTVADEGPGLRPGFAAHTGVRALRGWAAAVGGTTTVRRGLPGTLVEAMLPVALPVPLPVRTGPFPAQA